LVEWGHASQYRIASLNQYPPPGLAATAIRRHYSNDSHPMARFIPVDGPEREIKPRKTHWTLGELQALVGGYIQGVPWPDGRQLICNEDGKRLGLPRNDKATVRATMTGYFADSDYLVGDVLILEPEELE
jgi:hypothetical protein